MNILTALQSDWLTTTNTARTRRLHRSWAGRFPILEKYPTAFDAIAAAQRHEPGSDDILNAFLALSATEPLARQGIVVAFVPWIANHLSRRRVFERELADRASVLVAAFVEAAVTLSASAPIGWPAPTIVHEAENPINRYYRHLDRVAEPLEPDVVARAALPLVWQASTGKPTGPEIAIAGLVAELRAQRITLDDANLVARMIADGTSARSQSAGLYLSPRGAQHRVNRVIDQLTANAA